MDNANAIQSTPRIKLGDGCFRQNSGGATPTDTLQPVNLKLDWCTHAAAKHAVMNWHYSKTMPVGKSVKIGVWENGQFIGAVIFGRGANNNMLKPYGLSQTEGCELVRIALRKHITPVSRIIKIALLFLKKNSPDLRIICFIC
jgi:hypothetical protein